MEDDKELDTYLEASTIIEEAKARHDIRKPNSEMADKEIATIMRFLGSGAHDTVWIDGKPTLMRKGLGIMLSLSLYEFPEFYARHELWQRN